MQATYSCDAVVANSILAGDTDAWAECTAKVMRAIGTWKSSHNVDYEDIVNFAIFKAAKTYIPKRRFINHAIHICRNMLAQSFRYNRVRADIGCCSVNEIADQPHNTSGVLDQMIAREDALTLLQAGTNCYVMTQLILAGKTRAEAARIMGIDRFKAHSVVSKMRDMLDTEED